MSRRCTLVLQVFNFLNTINLQDQYAGGRVTNAFSASFGRILSARPMAQGELAAKLMNGSVCIEPWPDHDPSLR